MSKVGYARALLKAVKGMRSVLGSLKKNYLAGKTVAREFARGRRVKSLVQKKTDSEGLRIGGKRVVEEGKNRRRKLGKAT